MAEQLLSGWPSREQFAPAQSYQLPQCVRESQRLGVIRFRWALPFMHSDYYRGETEVMERSETGQNLVAGKLRVIVVSAIGSPRR